MASPLPAIKATKSETSRSRQPAAVAPSSGKQMHLLDGAPNYLTAGERDRFLREAEQGDRQVRTLCMTPTYAGCRLSEALALTADRVDLAAGVLVYESLKKRPLSRMSGRRVVHAVMEAAEPDGPHASSKGLRHDFGVTAVSTGIPLNLVQRWLGQAQLSTTAIYAETFGSEEKDIASKKLDLIVSSATA